MYIIINIFYEQKNDSMVAINYHKLDDSLVMVFISSIWKWMDVCTGKEQCW